MLGLNRARFLLAALPGLALASTAALGQADFSGEWAPIHTEDSLTTPYPGQFAGLPLNAEAIRRAEIWAASVQSSPDWQCEPHSAANIESAAPSLRIWKEVDSASGGIVSFEAQWPTAVRMSIYMDGRAHPPAYAIHTWGGFSTGKYQGDRLKIETSHLKADEYRGNGVPQSDETTLTQYLIRRRFKNHDYLTWLVIAYDPVYLTQPLLRSTDFRLVVDGPPPKNTCGRALGAVSSISPVPKYSPTATNALYNFVDAYDLPRKLYSDGAETMYPEYRNKIEQARKAAAQAAASEEAPP